MSLDTFHQIERWLEHGDTVAMATVVRTAGSSPRPLGSKMAISSTGEFVGSVSGGCIEGAVIEEASGVMNDGNPKRLEYGITDEQAWEVGLSCGGEIVVFVERIEGDSDSTPPVSNGQQSRLHSYWFSQLHRTLLADQDIRSVTVTQSGNQNLVGAHALLEFSSAGPPAARFESSSKEFARLLNEDPKFEPWLRTLEPGTHPCTLEQQNERQPPETSVQELKEGAIEVFVEHYQPPPRLVIVGAVHIAEHLVHFAQRLGFYCVVVDARATFATPKRFPHADQLLVGWPGEIVKELPLRSTTYCAFLTHDPKLDDPAILVALNVKARYIGALGSRKTHAKRCQRLAEEGVTKADLERIDAPIGLHLGGRKPEEIALAIAARLVQVRAGSS